MLLGTMPARLSKLDHRNTSFAAPEPPHATVSCGMEHGIDIEVTRNTRVYIEDFAATDKLRRRVC